MLAAVIVMNTAAFASTDDKVNKTVSKARTAVEQASPDDWMTLAKSAQICFRKNVNLKEAASWIDRSLEIKESAFNLEVKGDYYAANNLSEKALEYYVASMIKGMEEDPNFDSRPVQAKIVKVKK